MIKKTFFANQPYHPLSTLDLSLGNFRVGVWLICFVLIISLFAFSFSFSFAAQDDGIFTYVFHFYFENGVLVKDRDFDFPFELMAQEFQDSEIAAGGYYGEILSVTDKKLADFPIFFPAGGKGAFSPMAPYFDNAKTANFYNPQNLKLLTIDLAPDGPVCNEDKQCSTDTGETYLNCPGDCSAPVSSITPVPMPIGKSDFSFWNTFAPYLLLVGLMVLVLIGWVIIRRFKKKKNMLSPPQI